MIYLKKIDSIVASNSAFAKKCTKQKPKGLDKIIQKENRLSCHMARGRQKTSNALPPCPQIHKRKKQQRVLVENDSCRHLYNSLASTQEQLIRIVLFHIHCPMVCYQARSDYYVDSTGPSSLSFYVPFLSSCICMTELNI